MGNVLRGDIFWANLEPVKGSEQGGIRPVIILQNDTFNIYSTTTIIAPLTSQKPSKRYLTSVFVLKQDLKLKKDSTILLNQIRTIDKARLIKKIGTLQNDLMKKVELAIKTSLGMD